MSRTVLLTASVVLALVAACMAALVVASMKPAEAAFPGRNGFIAFDAVPNDGPDQIFRIKPDGTRVRALTTAAEGYSVVPVWSPNGKKIAFDRTTDDVAGDGEIYLMNADGSGKVNLTKSPNLYEFSPSFYPSGRKIIFNASPVEGTNYYVDMELYSISFDAAGNATGPPTRLTNNSFPDILPVVSADGKKIAWVSARDESAENYGDREIYVMNAAPEGPNNEPVQLTDNAYDDGSPDFSPDGRRIVYHSDRSGDYEVIVMSATDGSGKKNLTHNPARDYAPVFSPDGNMVAFSRTGQDFGAVWKMRADGRRQTKVSGDYEFFAYASPDWQPRP